MSETELNSWIAAVSGQGVGVQGSQKAYEEWAKTYTEDSEKFGFKNSYAKIATILRDMFPEDQRDCLRILDVGAGTGLVAKELRKYGFKHIDALEPCEAMLTEARKQNLYENYHVEFITGSHSSLPADTYDVLTGSGIFGDEGHVPSEALHEMVRLVKPGGHVVIVANQNFVHNSKNYKDLEPLVDKLEADRKWKKVSRETFECQSVGSCLVERFAWCYRVL